MSPKGKKSESPVKTPEVEGEEEEVCKENWNSEDTSEFFVYRNINALNFRLSKSTNGTVLQWSMP